jgi:Reverse transcriptase (RNA-dependent DNA polymerase)/Zinc knuckle
MSESSSSTGAAPAPVVSDSSTAGRGRGRGGRGRGRGGRTGSRPTTSVVFKGNTDGLKGNVFQCHGEHTNKQQFIKTIGVLDEHINKTFTYPQDVASVCKLFTVTKLTPPDNLTKDEYENDMGKKMIWETTMKTYLKRLDMMESNLRAIYAIVWGQCSPLMQAKLESLDNYAMHSGSCNCIWLLNEIKGITHQFESTRIAFVSLDAAWVSYYKYNQGPDQSLHDYLKDYQSMVEVLEHYGAVIGTAGPYLALVKERVRLAAPQGTTATQLEERERTAAKLQSIAVSFMTRSDQRRYGGLCSELENNFARGLNHYPHDLTAAYNLLLNYKAAPATSRPPRRDGNTSASGAEVSGVSFLQAADPTPGTNNITHERVKCYNCQLYGHYSADCPTSAQDGVQMLQTTTMPTQADQIPTEETLDSASSFSFAQAATGHNIIPHDWILLDSQSTVSVFNNRALLTDIRKSNTILRVHTNGGTQISTEKGHIRNFGDVWYNPKSLANILSMAEVRKVCRITMDTSLEAAMHVHRKDGTIMTFKEYTSGLYFFDTGTPSPPNTYSPGHDYLFLNTVAANKQRYTRHEIEGADKARALYRKIGRPSEKDFTHILQNNLIRNCPITADDARRALRIYGPDIATLKGKTVKKQNEGIPDYQAIQIPAPIIAQYKNVRLFIDIFWVNGNPFFHTISEWIKFRTIAPITNRNKKTLLLETKVIINLYETRGFVISRVEGDHEFACLTNDLLPTPINICDADDHVHEVERSIRTIKERTRCLVQGLPFRRIPKLMMRAAVENANKVMNLFPAHSGVSDTMSPLTIMTGKPSPDYNDMKIEFGAYAQVYENNDPTNTMKTRTTGAIALTPTGNAQGGYNFMSLITGRKLSRQQWDALPMPDGVVAAVEAMAANEQQPIVGHGAPFFEWAPGVPIEDEPMGQIVDDADDNNNDPADEAIGAEADNDEAQGADEDNDNVDVNIPNGNVLAEHIDDDYAIEQGSFQEGEDLEFDNNDNDDNVEFYEAEVNDEPNGETDYGANQPETAEYDNADDNVNAHDDVSETPRYNLRPDRTRSYGNRLGHIMDNPASSKSYDVSQFLQNGYKEEASTLRAAVQEMQLSGQNNGVLKCITGVVMMQMTAKAGIKKHGQVAIDALFEEFSQLHDLGVFLGQDRNKLTASEKRGALRAINVIKEKRCGRIKGRTVADGRAQRDLYTKEETSSPTVSTDALMLSIMIDAKERRDVATADVAGAYLHADMDDFTLLKMEGESVDIMCNVSTEYKRFVHFENGKKVLYLRLMKALYGCVKSALLWYELFSSTLEGLGFELNPYDPCVANKMIDGKQCTIVWYVDDTKISHQDDNVVSNVIELIESKFGKMTVTRGREHVFLGMKIDFHTNGTASIRMKEYIAEAIQDFGEDISRQAATPAKKNLFDIDGKSEELTGAKKEVFHSVVAKLLYVSKRGRPDIQLPIAFLCTRVAHSTDEDWMKLKRVLEYLHGTMDEFLTIGADSIEDMYTWTDASYAVHEDMRSHTGGTVSFGTGAAMSKSSKQKLNTKSSTEAELVGASDYLSYPIWAKKFLGGQGYVLKKNIFYQDNQSTIRFEKNGRKSCGPNSRHIDIRYFFIKDRLNAEQVAVVHCPTEQMLADFFTKPLQGSLFRKFRDVIMGQKHIDTLKTSTVPPSQERVELVESEEVVNEVNGLVTDERDPEQRMTTYADIVRRIGVSKVSDASDTGVGKSTKNKRLGSERGKLLASLTFKK